MTDILCDFICYRFTVFFYQVTEKNIILGIEILSRHSAVFTYFESSLAQLETEVHTELPISMNIVKNFCLRNTIKLDSDTRYQCK